MNKKEYIQFNSDFCERMKTITVAKNHDYGGKDDNPFTNFTMVGVYGIDPVAGFLTRMSDKMARINSFRENGKLLVANESVEDTLTDLANYSCLLAGYLKSLQVPK